MGKVAALLMKACDIRSKAPCDAVNARSKDGESALHVNAIKGDGETTKVLLAYGAEVDARTPRGPTLQMTPLMWAAYGGHAEMVRLLLAAGADPLTTDENGKTVLQAARNARATDVDALLLEAIRARQEVGSEAGGSSRSVPGKEEL